MESNLEDYQDFDALSQPSYNYEETLGYGKYKTNDLFRSSSSNASYKSSKMFRNNNADVGDAPATGGEGTGEGGNDDDDLDHHVFGVTPKEERAISSPRNNKLTEGSLSMLRRQGNFPQDASDEEAVIGTPAKDLRYYEDNWQTRCLSKSRYLIFERFGDDWIFLTLLGLISALLGLATDEFVEALSSMKDDLLYTTELVFGQYCLWVLYMITFVVFSIGFTHYVAPTAIGSGIPEMKTILKGIDLFHYLSFRTMLAKIVGLSTALGCGLPLGKEGPFVHISSIIAHKLSKHVFRGIGKNEARRMEMLGAACAVGVSSNFGAPVGGVLFSIEVTSTYFAVRNYWRGFFAAVVSALLFRLFALFINNERTITSLFTTDFDEFPYDAEELIAYAAIGVFAGLLAALFVWTHRKLIDLRRKYLSNVKIFTYNRYMYPIAVVFIIATLTFPSFIGQYMGLSQKKSIDELFSKDPLETLSDWNSPNIFVSLLIFLVLKFLMTAVAVSLPIPAGVFVPVFVIGAAYGRFFGELMSRIFPHGIQEGVQADIIPGGYAVVGAAALAAGVTHTISTSVIVFELTGQIHHILPVMIAVLISNAVAQTLMPSFYDSIIQIKKLPYLPDLRKKRTYNITAGDIMNRDLFWISAQSTYGDIQRLLAKSRHRSYPLVDSEENMILIGSIRRDQLEQMLVKQLARAIVGSSKSDDGRDSRSSSRNSSRNSSRSSSRAGSPTRDEKEHKETYFVETETAIRRSSSKKNVRSGSRFLPESDFEIDDAADIESSVAPAETILQRKLELLRESLRFRGHRIDASPFQIVQRTSLHKIHTLFSLLGLTYAYVTSHGRVVGVLTLKELRAAIEGTLEEEREEERMRQLDDADEDEDDMQDDAGKRAETGSASIQLNHSSNIRPSQTMQKRHLVRHDENDNDSKDDSSFQSFR